MEKLGPDHFLNLLLKKSGETPTELVKKIDELLGRFPTADYLTQQKIRGEIVGLDRKAAAALKKRMDDAQDFRLKQMVREVLNNWSEPR